MTLDRAPAGPLQYDLLHHLLLQLQQRRGPRGADRPGAASSLCQVEKGVGCRCRVVVVVVVVEVVMVEVVV